MTLSSSFVPSIWTKTHLWVQEKDEPLRIKELERGRLGEGYAIEITSKDELEAILKFSQIVLISPEENPESAGACFNTESVHAQIQTDLQKKGFKYTPIQGRYKGKEENSYMVYVPNRKLNNIVQSLDHPDLKELVDLGKKYQQDSILYSSWGRQFYYYTHGEKIDSLQYGEGFSFFEQEPSDCYSEVFFSDGQKTIFRLNIDETPFYLTIDALANQLENRTSEHYRDFFVLRGGEPHPLHLPPPCSRISENKIIFLLRGVESVDSYAKELKADLSQHFPHSTVAISTAAHIMQINREENSKENNWEEIRTEKDRRNQEAVKFAMENHYPFIIFAAVGKCLSHLSPFIEIAETFKYQPRIIQCGINDPKHYPYTARHSVHFQGKEENLLLIGGKKIVQYQNIRPAEVIQSLPTS